MAHWRLSLIAPVVKTKPNIQILQGSQEICLIYRYEGGYERGQWRNVVSVSLCFTLINSKDTIKVHFIIGVYTYV